MKLLSKIKDKLYNALVLSNESVRRDYQGKIDADPTAHKKFRLKSWLRLIKLNIKYRILKRPYREKWEELIISNTPVPNHDSPKASVPVPSVKKPAPPAKASLKNPMVYLGAESAIEKKDKPEHLIKKLLEYDVISFDIFDTLLFRPLAKPKDVFVLLNKVHDTIGFDAIRMRAESEARQIRKARFGDTEPTLQEIYEQVFKYTGISPKYGAEKEIELESQLLFANPYMKRVFDMLKQNHKRLIAVSDMYLPKEILTNILNKCGYEGFEEIFVSCECKCGKKDGALFDYVKNHISFKTIIHIDDNWAAILAARNQKWAAHHYKNVNNVGLCHRTPTLSPLIGSAYAGIVNQHLYNGLRQYSPIYEFGFTYGGFFALGYCSWIHQYCKQNGIDKILFLSRDGYILKQIYEKLYDDIESEYFYFSRIAGSRISVRSWFYLFLDSFVLKKVKSVKMPISWYLELMDLTPLKDNLVKYGISTTDILSEENKVVYDSFIEFLSDYKDEIYHIFETEMKAAKKYISDSVLGCKKVAVVDIGWRGSSAIAIKRFVKRECNLNTEVVGLMAAAPYEVNATQLLDQSLACYMFSLNHNYNALSKHERFKADNAIYEFFLTACHPTLKKFDWKNGEVCFEFEEPDVENYPFIQEIHQGMLDFADSYISAWRNFDFMFEIPGNDVAMNVQHLIGHKEYFTKFFKDFKYNMGVGGETVSFADIIKNN